MTSLLRRLFGRRPSDTGRLGPAPVLDAPTVRIEPGPGGAAAGPVGPFPSQGSDVQADAAPGSSAALSTVADPAGAGSGSSVAVRETDGAPAPTAADAATVVLKLAYEATRFPATAAPQPSDAAAAPATCPITQPRPKNSSRERHVADANTRLAKVQEKISRLAEEFAQGQVNRVQFQELFDHYQEERRTILAWIETDREAPDWQKLAAEGRSMIIRRKHRARVQGYAICDSRSGLPLKVTGRFVENDELIVPMLTCYRSATQEIFGAGMRSTQIEDGEWLCFVTGEFTTLMVLFTTEPAGKDLESLDELLRIFERMNRLVLRREPIAPEDLFLPYRFYLETPG